MTSEEWIILGKLAGGFVVVWALYEFFIAWVLQYGDEVPIGECIHGAKMNEECYHCERDEV